MLLPASDTSVKARTSKRKSQRLRWLFFAVHLSIWGQSKNSDYYFVRGFAG